MARYGHERVCVECGRSLVLSPQRPGWTPLPARDGWACPDCSRRLGLVPRGAVRPRP